MRWRESEVLATLGGLSGAGGEKQRVVRMQSRLLYRIRWIWIGSKAPERRDGSRVCNVTETCHGTLRKTADLKNGDGATD